MRKISLVVAGALALGWTAARAQTGAGTFNTTSPNPNPMGLPDPTAPPSSPTEVAPAPPPTSSPTEMAPTPPLPPPSSEEASPAAPPPPVGPTPSVAPAPTAGTTTPAPAPNVNVNPAPTAPPPLGSPPDNNAAAMTGAVVADVPAQPLPPMTADHGDMYRPAGFTSFGWAAFVGGGYEDFTNSNIRNRTGGAGAWDARLIGGTHSYLGFEAAYVGAARSINALGLSNNSTLVSNGFEGAFRVNVPVMRGNSLYEPFGFVGLGWSHYRVTNYNATVTSDIGSGDSVMTVPFGAGFAYGYRSFIADARVAYTPTFFNNLLQSTNDTGTLNHWGVGGNIGISF